jgi:hypothetical protein
MPSSEIEEMLAAAAEAEAAQGSKPIGACIRLLQCYTCKTLEVLPDYPQAANPQDDASLHYVNEKHGGETQNPHNGALHRIEKRVWEDRAAKRQIVDEMWKGTTGFTPSYYDVKDQMRDDAVTCWNEHRKPNSEQPCLDYRDNSKIIRPPTRKDRKQMARELELAGQRNNIDLDRLANDMPKLYLCSFCPYQTVVDHKKRMMRGEE